MLIEQQLCDPIVEQSFHTLHNDLVELSLPKTLFCLSELPLHLATKHLLKRTFLLETLTFLLKLLLVPRQLTLQLSQLLLFLLNSPLQPLLFYLLQLDLFDLVEIIDYFGVRHSWYKIFPLSNDL